MWRFVLSVGLIAALGACADEHASPSNAQWGLAPSTLATPKDLPPPTQCALFAREFTGIHIRGDAWSWWQLAEGADYPRSNTPRADTILVLRSTPQLKLGHVGIVKRIVGPREILITHANWGMDDPTKRIIHDSTAVVDVSKTNDWTELRFWNAPAHAFGKIYAAYGFIYPHRFTADGEAVW
jgi:surface antigen